MHAFDSSASFTRTPPPATGHDVLGTVEAIFAEMELTTVPVEPSAAERATILRWENAILETPFRALLLVDPGIRSSKLHLAASDFSAAGRMAIPDDWHLQPTASELWEMVSEPAWSRRTLCGRSWSHLDFSDPVSMVRDDDEGLCRTCKGTLVKMFLQDSEDAEGDVCPADT